MKKKMAFAQVPQRLAIENMHRMRDLQDDDDDILLLAVLALRRRRRQREEQGRMARRWWVKPWIRQRPIHSQFYTIFEELDLEVDEDYRGYVRIDRNMFAQILQRIEPRITKDPRFVKTFIIIIFHKCI